MQAARQLLLDLFEAGLVAVRGRTVTRNAIVMAPVGSRLRQLLAGRSVGLFAVGKAAADMALGAHDALGEQISSAVIITRADYAVGIERTLPFATVVESAHPVPDARSLAAGQLLCHSLTQLDRNCLPLFLISGGASSLVEVLCPGVSLEELQRCNEQGLAAGIGIDELNVRRAQLSQLKAGGLTALLAGRPAVALFISDVPGDQPEVIGSGLLAPSPQGDAVCRQVIANAELARQSVVAAGRGRGLRVREFIDRFSTDALSVAKHCVEAARASDAQLLVWCGESTVRLPAQPGRGGRNQQLALAAAIHLDGSDDLFLLAAGTDGSDGNSDDAGALVDGGSCARMRLHGADPQASLVKADAGTALAIAEDLISTGPTGTNVGDLVIALRAVSMV